MCVFKVSKTFVPHNFGKAIICNISVCHVLHFYTFLCVCMIKAFSIWSAIVIL